jgi:hypothetical protein
MSVKQMKPFMTNVFLKAENKISIHKIKFVRNFDKINMI